MHLAITLCLCLSQQTAQQPLFNKDLNLSAMYYINTALNIYVIFLSAGINS